jgi:putative addiction module killer protein
MSIIKINFYETSRGKQPFVDWQEDLDEVDQAIIDARLTRVRLGNFGDCTRIKGGEGIWELRIDVGPGWRIYYGKEGLSIVLLLIGGIKKSQTKDIATAKKYWLDHKG